MSTPRHKMHTKKTVQDHQRQAISHYVQHVKLSVTTKSIDHDFNSFLIACWLEWQNIRYCSFARRDDDHCDSDDGVRKSTVASCNVRESTNATIIE